MCINSYLLWSFTCHYDQTGSLFSLQKITLNFRWKTVFNIHKCVWAFSLMAKLMNKHFWSNLVSHRWALRRQYEKIQSTIEFHNYPTHVIKRNISIDTERQINLDANRRRNFCICRFQSILNITSSLLLWICQMEMFS